MSDQQQGPGWWRASDGKWYPPNAPTGFPPAYTPMPDPPQQGGMSNRTLMAIIGGIGVALIGLVVLLASGSDDGQDVRSDSGPTPQESSADTSNEAESDVDAAATSTTTTALSANPATSPALSVVGTVQVPERASPKERANVYATLGVTLTYQPDRDLVEVQAVPAIRSTAVPAPCARLSPTGVPGQRSQVSGLRQGVGAPR